MAGLDELFDAYEREHLRPNAGEDLEMRLNDFVNEIQESGNDVSSWSEDEWREVLARAGFNEEDMPDALDNLASWGVVDNFVWAEPGSIEEESLDALAANRRDY